MKLRTVFLPTIVVISVFLVGCGSAGSGGGGSSQGAPPPDPLASFTADVSAIASLPADPSATEIYAYATAVSALADLYGITDEDVSDVLTAEIADEALRNQILGVVFGTLTLQELMVQNTGVYEDPDEQIVLGLPLNQDLPSDSPVQVNGSPTVVDDGVRVGMNFDQPEDYLVIPAAPSNDLTHDGTIELWVKPTRNIRWAGLVHKGTEADWSDEGYSFQYDGSRRLLLAMTSAAGDLMLVRTNHQPAVGVWSHIVATWDSDEVHIYANGTEVTTNITVGFSSTTTTVADNYPFRSSDGDVVIGTQIPGNSWRFDGVISDVRIFDRYMDASEVSQRAAGN